MLLGYGNHYYIESIARLEAALARKPRVFQIDLIGVGEIPANSALLIRSVLLSRSSKTRLITHARSSLQNGSVLKENGTFGYLDHTLTTAEMNPFFPE
jgi:hypothetical protein